MRIAYISSGNSIHDRRFIQKFETSDHEFLLLLIHSSNGELPTTARSIYLGGDDKFRILPTTRRMLRAWRRTRTALRTWKPDLVHAGPLNTGGILAALSCTRPLLLMPWGSDVLVWSSRSRWRTFIARCVIRRSTMITVDAQVVKGRILALAPSYAPQRIVVFPWGVDQTLFFPSARNNEALVRSLELEGLLVIICTRLLQPVYGHHYLLLAVQQLVDRVGTVALLIAGDGPLRHTLEAEARSLGLDPVVHFLGSVSNTHLADYLNVSDIYVSASMSDGTSVSLLEAMSCGLPSVVTDVPANLEWIVHGETGLVTAPANAEQLASQLVDLAIDPARRHSMGERALAVAHVKANWDLNYKALERMYRAINDGSR